MGVSKNALSSKKIQPKPRKTLYQDSAVSVQLIYLPIILSTAPDTLGLWPTYSFSVHFF